MSNTKSKLFKTDVEFCSACGTILPLPGPKPTVKCLRCHHEISVLEFNNVEVQTTVIFNKKEHIGKGLHSDDFSGPLVERKCTHCGSEKMTYATRQTRSADEGQTIFYTCTVCKFQEIENS